jgi:putative addiction module component (TIGR02574 family)
MLSTAEQLEAAALQLPPSERAWLAERLISSLDQDEEIAAAWDDEIRRRLEELDAGLVEEIPAEEVLAKLRARAR